MINPNKLRLARWFERLRLNDGLLRAQRLLLGPHIRALNYHDISIHAAVDFERQLAFYARHFVSVDREALLGPLVVALGAAAVLALGMASIGTSAAIGRRRAPVGPGGGFGPSGSLVAVEPPPPVHGRSEEAPESEVVDDPEGPRSDADSSGLVERPSRRRGRAAAADRRHERNRLVDTLLDDTTWPDEPG